ncbi:MAG: hypothetical protein Aurels2KO_07370 [Aureliella sp.]
MLFKLRSVASHAWADLPTRLIDINLNRIATVLGSELKVAALMRAEPAASTSVFTWRILAQIRNRNFTNRKWTVDGNGFN